MLRWWISFLRFCLCRAPRSRLFPASDRAISLFALLVGAAAKCSGSCVTTLRFRTAAVRCTPIVHVQPCFVCRGARRYRRQPAHGFSFTPEEDENQGRLSGRRAFPADFCAGVHAAVIVDRFGVAAGGPGECPQTRLLCRLAGGGRLGRVAADLIHPPPGPEICPVHDPRL